MEYFDNYIDNIAPWNISSMALYKEYCTAEYFVNDVALL